jgi:diadenosine tetraphosphate (Ap4A) HIT family hydrolase
MTCHFCELDKLKNRIFYDDGRWFSFLAAPFHTKGHTILAAKKQNGRTCPEGLKWEVFAGFDNALAGVARILQAHYRPKDILFASLRGDITHCHCHLIPRWEDEETKWRQQQSYNENGHRMEFLGYLEKTGDAKAEAERNTRSMSSEAQRSEIEERLTPDVAALRELADYWGPAAD